MRELVKRSGQAYPSLAGSPTSSRAMWRQRPTTHHVVQAPGACLVPCGVIPRDGKTITKDGRMIPSKEGVGI